MFVRRSRKGRIHMVRERVKKGYRYISGGLRDANELTQHFAAKVARDLGRGIKETGQEIGIPSRNRVRTLTKGIEQTKDSFNRGVNSVHKSSQLALAKGHQSIQSGLKKIQKNTGDFNMHYQYEPPVAMFSMAEVDKYNRYSEATYLVDDGYANFAIDLRKKGSAPRSQIRQDLGAAGRALKSAPGAAWKGAKSGASGGYRLARGAAVGGYGLARKGVVGGYGLAKGAAAGGYGLAKGGARGLGGLAAGGLGKASGGLGKLSAMAAANPGKAGALLAGAAAVGAGGTMFMRRRRTKSGKIVVEQVRR